MSIKIGINGFGRIGRMVMRAALNHPQIEIVGINDLCPADYLAYMLKYDTMHGKFGGDVSSAENAIIINGKSIPVFAERNPADLPWGELGAEYVVESTGLFLTKEKSQAHIDAGAKHVVMSAPSKDDTPMFVMGVNQDTYTSDMQFVSNASCTTNCLAPVTKVIHDNFTIVAGIMTTVHSFTNDQKNLDARHKDPRRARGCTQSIIPTTTGAAKAMGKIIPELNGKMNGFALRVPTPNVSLTDVVFQIKEDFTVEQVNTLLKEAAEGPMKGILGYSDKPLVSIDYNTDPRSSIVDGLSTMKVGDDLLKVIAWYDNEWGYSNRVVDLAKYIATK